MLNLQYSPTPDNPYAWDTPDDTGQYPSESYDELGSFSQFLRVNYAITTVVGGLLSFMLLYLILFHTSGALKNYRNMLLICSATDIFYWSIDNFIGLKIKEKDGVFMVKMEGPAKHFDRPARLIFVSTYVYSICFLNTVLPSQVYFRYYALTSRPDRSKFLTTAKTFQLLTASMLAALPTFFVAYIGYGSSPEVRPGHNYGELWYKEVPIPPVLYADVRSIYQKLYFIYAGFLVSVSYTIAIILGYRTLQKINILYSSYSKRTKRLQAQLSHFLIVQSIVPLLISVAPSMLIVTPAFFFVDTGRACLVYSLLFSWIPILNPLITIFVIIPYRQFILRKMCMGKKRNEVASTGNVYRSRSTADETS